MFSTKLSTQQFRVIIKVKFLLENHVNNTYIKTFISISLLASVFPVSLPLFFLFLQPCLIRARMPDWFRAFCAWTHFLAFMEWAEDIGSQSTAWHYVPVQSSFCSLRVFYRTFAVGNDTYKTPFIIIIIPMCLLTVELTSPIKPVKVPLGSRRPPKEGSTASIL